MESVIENLPVNLPEVSEREQSFVWPSRGPDGLLRQKDNGVCWIIGSRVEPTFERSQSVGNTHRSKLSYIPHWRELLWPNLDTRAAGHSAIETLYTFSEWRV